MSEEIDKKIEKLKIYATQTILDKGFNQWVANKIVKKFKSGEDLKLLIEILNK